VTPEEIVCRLDELSRVVEQLVLREQMRDAADALYAMLPKRDRRTFRRMTELERAAFLKANADERARMLAECGPRVSVAAKRRARRRR
jgi:hypothetical protein